MKYVKEVMWIIAFTFLGEVLNVTLHLPIPAGVYGMILMYLALSLKIVKLEDVEGAGNILLDTMTMMFIPAAVKIMTAVSDLRPVLVPYIIIVVLSTAMVMAATGSISQLILRRKEKKQLVFEALNDEEISLEPHETFGIGRRPLSPNGEMDGSNGYAEIVKEKKEKKEV